MNRVDVVDLVVDLVDVDLDIDLVDVDLDVDLVDVGLVDVVPAVFSRVRIGVGVGVGVPLWPPAKNTRGRKGTLGKRGLTSYSEPTVARKKVTQMCENNGGPPVWPRGHHFSLCGI